MSGLYFSRMALRRDGPARALLELLDPEDEDRRMDAHHRLIWTAFGGAEAQPRDFLWRAEGRGLFYALSRREPAASDLLKVETQPFAPALKAGDRLGFLLRANATMQRFERGGRGPRVDVVMNALKPIPKSERAQARADLAQGEGLAWLARQGGRAGFGLDPDEAAVESYRVARPPRRGTDAASFGVLDFRGLLTVTDPAAFLARLAEGFGRARGFGCGLMLIRRA